MSSFDDLQNMSIEDWLGPGRDDIVSETTTAGSPDQLAPKSSRALAVLKSGVPRTLGSWGVKIVAGFLMGVGAVLTATGVGAAAGVPLMIAGGVTYGVSQGISTATAAAEADEKGESVAKAVGKDLGKGFLMFGAGTAVGAAAAGFGAIASSGFVFAGDAVTESAQLVGSVVLLLGGGVGGIGMGSKAVTAIHRAAAGKKDVGFIKT
jgi:hypothetical protein